MKSTLRALRRHHRQRMIRRAGRILRWEEKPEERWGMVLRWYNNLAKSSCWPCGNPRRVRGEYRHGLTLQERRLHTAANEDRERLFGGEAAAELAEVEE